MSFFAFSGRAVSAALVLPLSGVLFLSSFFPCTSHRWKEATFLSRQTCTVCGAVTGEPLKVQKGYQFLNNMTYEDKEGKIYYHLPEGAEFYHNSDYADYTAPGYVKSPMDARGNLYLGGIHLDGARTEKYYVTYALNGEYRQFHGWLAPSSICLTSDTTSGYEKYIRIYCDGVLVYTSPVMDLYSEPVKIDISVGGARELKIEYSDTKGSNDLAVLYDAYLS